MILMAGDSHCDYYFIKKLYTKAKENNIKNIIVCGDFGYWPVDNQGKQFLWNLNNLFRNKDMKLYFVDGNHEDYNYLKKLPQDRVSQIPEAENVMYIPRGIVTEIDGRKIMGFGGGVSIDKEYRTVDKDWFKEELITDEQIRNMSKEPIDILITHDAPLMPHKLYFKNDPISAINREKIQQICIIKKPNFLFHGHYHTYQEYIYKDVTCYSLADNTTLMQNQTILF